jgi:hypothetical protein
VNVSWASFDERRSVPGISSPLGWPLLLVLGIVYPSPWWQLNSGRFPVMIPFAFWSRARAGYPG